MYTYLKAVCCKPGMACANLLCLNCTILIDKTQNHVVPADISSIQMRPQMNIGKDRSKVLVLWSETMASDMDTHNISFLTFMCVFMYNNIDHIS